MCLTINISYILGRKGTLLVSMPDQFSLSFINTIIMELKDEDHRLYLVDYAPRE